MGMSDDYAAAAAAIAAADALIITAGAGMGVDSGLPDFRGDRGFWQAYPMYERLGLSFVDAANPQHFGRDPLFGWGFYGHRTNLYRQTEPHAGFSLLLDWISRHELASFVVTSNVDGQFQVAGFDPDSLLEVHGSIHHLQCLSPCCHDIWPNRAEFKIDHSVMRADRAPACPSCGGVARPNILMFGDYSWLSDRTAAQEERFSRFMAQYGGKKLVVIEMGAGSAVPTIRHLSENLGSRQGVDVIRINPREPRIGGGHFSFAVGALEGLEQLARHL
jgi:NAD-dependent SIR2 family protein deacetylase